MKNLLLSLIIILCFTTPVLAELTAACTYNEDAGTIFCIINEDIKYVESTETPYGPLKPKALPAIIVPVVRTILIEVTKAVTVDLLKEMILNTCRTHKDQVVKINLVTIKSH